MAAPKLRDVGSMYGAPMGRNEHTDAPKEAVLKFYLARVPLDNGGYDSGGAYWGIGTPLYRAYADTEDSYIEFYMRAYDRERAKEKVLAQYPNAKFFR